MVELNFLVDGNYLLAHTLFHNVFPPKYGRDVSELREKGRKRISRVRKCTLQFMLLEEMLTETLLLPNAQKLADRLMGTDEYQRVLRRVQGYRSIVEAKWLASHDRTSRMMQEITGLDFSNDQFTVYSTLLKDGRYMGYRRIVWSPRKERYPNADVVDLWHEIMHGKMKTGGRDIPLSNDIEHSVIQLATDNELRVRLNGGEYPPFVGHESHLPVMEKMLPYWQRYLVCRERNILKFYRGMERVRRVLTR